MVFGVPSDCSPSILWPLSRSKLIEVITSSPEASGRRSQSAEPRSPLSEVTEDRRHSVNSNTPDLPPSPRDPPAAAAAAAAKSFANVEEKKRRKPARLAPEADEVIALRLLLLLLCCVCYRAGFWCLMFFAGARAVAVLVVGAGLLRLVFRSEI